MEEVLSRFPHIGEAFFKKLNGKDFFKSMAVTRSWNYFIRNQRLLQRAYKNHKAIQDRIQTLTEEIENRGFRQLMITPFHLAAEKSDCDWLLKVLNIFCLLCDFCTFNQFLDLQILVILESPLHYSLIPDEIIPRSVYFHGFEEVFAI